MTAIRNLFDPSKPIDRRIEKVITYDATNEELLKREIQEYVATESIEQHFERMLDYLEEGLAGADVEVGVWVSGFYGSGKSSFTKYLGFALDPSRQIDGKPFLKWLQNQLPSQPLRQRLATAAKRFPTAVIMLDLASEQLAGATMAEISTVLYAKVMQWAGYSRDAKIAYLEFMLEKDGRLEDFQSHITKLSKGKSWQEIKNQPLVIKALASRVAAEFYPELFPDSKTFNQIRIEEQLKENDRVNHMLDLIERKAGTKNIIFILDEVGQYVAASNSLILNLDGLAKNIKNIGRGSCWIIATAQQTLTEDDPRMVTNTAKLFKLKDRFPVTIDLEASDIQEICYKRLLSKSSKGESELKDLFDRYGAQLRFSTELKNTQYYKSEIDKETFAKFYPFLPYHFEILLQLLARLAKTRGGVGLRSAIKVIQDVLVDPGKTRKGAPLLANEKVGVLATTVTFFDTLRIDIERPFPHIINGVAKTEKVFGDESLHAQIAKSVAILQILEDFPVSRENVSALMHPAVDAAALHDSVNNAVEAMLAEPAIPLNEVDGTLHFMSEAVLDLENDRLKIQPRIADTRSLFNTVLKEIFTPTPSARLNGIRSVSTGFKIYTGESPISLAGDKEFIQTHIEFIPTEEYESKKEERITESQQRSYTNTVFLLATEDNALDDILVEIYRCQEIYRQNRNKAADKDVEEYLRAQNQRAQKLEKGVESRLKKALEAGSFIFRAKPRSAGELGKDIVSATKKHLEMVAVQVFDKYAEAPVQTESATAEQFLKTERIEKIAGKYDPLELVKRGAAAPIDTQHKAIVSIKDYLEKHGQVDGRRLLDDFFAPRYGWSKDTTRYLIAAMLVAGLIKLRISGEDVTVRGDTAVNSLKNTNSFNKIGIALRDAPVDPENLLRSRERLLRLTGDEVMPLEEDISKCVMRHFPDYQQSYAPLAVQLENLELQGCNRVQSIQDNLAEILKGDASDAANRLGGEDCPLYEDLLWARAVKKAFDNGIGTVTRDARELLSELPKLPAAGILGELVTSTETERNNLAEHINREDFFNYMTEMQHNITEIEGHIRKAAERFIAEQADYLEEEKLKLQKKPEWALLGTEDRIFFTNELEKLVVSADANLNGIKQLINDRYYYLSEIERIQSEIKKVAEKVRKDDDDDNDGAEMTAITIMAPTIIQTEETLNDLIDQLKALKTALTSGKPIKITWR